MNIHKKVLIIILIAVSSMNSAYPISLNPISWIAAVLTIFQKKATTKINVTITSASVLGGKPTQQDFVHHEKYNNENTVIAAIAEGHGVKEETQKEKIDTAKEIFSNLKILYNYKGKEVLDLGATIAEYIVKALPERIAQKLKPELFFWSWLTSFFYTKKEDVMVSESFDEGNKELKVKLNTTNITNLGETTDKVPFINGQGLPQRLWLLIKKRKYNVCSCW